MTEDKHLQTFQPILQLPTLSSSSISCSREGTKGPLSAGGVPYRWDVKAERIRKGQERGFQLQGNKGKPIPPGIILILETGLTRLQINGTLWEKKEGGGVQSRICCPKESVPGRVQITPKVMVDPVTCSDVLVWMFTSLFWLCAHATPSKNLSLWLVLQSTMTQNCPTKLYSVKI